MLVFGMIPLVQKLSAFVDLDARELATLEKLHKRRRPVISGQALVAQGEIKQPTFILATGWVISYKIQPTGKRQIVDIQIPGDFLGLRSMLLYTSDQSIEPIVDSQVTEIQMSDINDMYASTPRLVQALLWAASRDEAMVVEHLVGVGQRDGDVRMGHFLLELGMRLSLVGLGGRDGYKCPLTQYHFADVLGMSAVHVNRVLKKLREDGLVTVRDGQVRLEDYDGLVELTGFDPAYLDQVRPHLT